MDLICEQPSDRDPPAVAGGGSWKQGYVVSKKSGEEVLDSSKKPEKEVFDSSEKPLLSEREVKHFLYMVSKKSEISEQELQAIYAVVEGGDPDKKLSESEAKSTRDLLDLWNKVGEILICEVMFDTKAEFQQKLEEVQKKQAAEELKRAEKVPQKCEVCTKVVQHSSFECPYLHNVPDPDNTPVGEGYEIVCRHCHESDHGHPVGTWSGFAYNWSTSILEGMSIRDEEEDPNEEEEEEEEEEDPNEEESVAEDPDEEDPEESSLGALECCFYGSSGPLKQGLKSRVSRKPRISKKWTFPILKYQKISIISILKYQYRKEKAVLHACYSRPHRFKQNRERRDVMVCG